MKFVTSKPPFALLLTIAFACLANAQGRTATVTSTRANLRETPSQTGTVKQEVPIGSEIKVLDNKGAWYVVRIADAVGWMHGNTFRFTSDSVVEPATPATEAAPSYPAQPTSRPSRVTGDSSPSGSTSSSPSSVREYIRGPRGGCYYYSRSGRKVYVDRSLCN